MTRIHLPIHIRWGDQDAFGHVNNATIAQILEEGRIRAFWVHEDPARRTPSQVFEEDLSVGGEGPFVILIAHQEIEYLRPMAYQQEPLDVRVWFGRLGGASAQVCYEVATSDAPDAPVLVRATSTIVLAHRDTLRPAKLTPFIREAWEPLVDEPLELGRR